MAYDKPIEIKVTMAGGSTASSPVPMTGSQAITTAQILNSIEKQLKATLGNDAIFNTNKASIDSKSNDITKSFVVRSDVVKIVIDAIKAKQDVFYRPVDITSHEARIRRNKVDIEGERALAALEADVSAVGGRVFRNNKETFIDLPYSHGTGALKSVTKRAKSLTKSYREDTEKSVKSQLIAEEKEKAAQLAKAEKEAQAKEAREAKEAKAAEAKWRKLLMKEEEKVAKDAKREEEKQEKQKEKEAKDAKREAEKQEKQKEKVLEKKQKQEEKEAEKEERQHEAERKKHSIALIAGISSSVILLKKLVSLVENITTSVIEQGQKSFETSMTAQRLNISPDLLRKLEYAGVAKGIGSAPVNSMLSLQDSFGSTLLAAENINKLKNIMPIIGADVEKLILNGSAGTNPLGMKTMLMNRLLKAYQEGSDGLGGTVSKKASAASLTSLARSALGDDFATEFSRATMDDATDYTAWLLDSMPVSTPSYNALNASSENYEQYNEALTEFKASLDTLFTQWSPLLNKLTLALDKLTEWIRRLTGDKEGIAEASAKNYRQAQESYARDSEAYEKAYKVRKDYAVRNEAKFGGVKAAMDAMTAFLDSGILPEQLEGDEEGIKEFLAMALNASLSRQLEENLRKSRKAITDYESNKSAYLSGEQSLSFAYTGLSQTMDEAQRVYEAATWKYYSSRLKAETPESLAEEEAYSALTPTAAKSYLIKKKLIEKKRAAIEKESNRGSVGKALSYIGRAFTGQTTDSEKFIAETQAEIEELTKANLVYEEKIKMHKESGFGPIGGVSDTDISSSIAKELMLEAIKEMVVQTMFDGPLPAGFKYTTYTDPNQTGILYIQLLDAQGKERGEPAEVPAYLAGPFNETMPYAMQGD